jgi:mono/diheme cytochrome c family protein
MTHRSQRTRLFAALVILIGAAGVTAALYSAWRRPTDRAVDIQLGRAVYAKSCAVCHGPAGEGQFPAPPLDFTGHAHHHPDWELYMVIAEGKVGFGEMPPWKGTLDDREIRSVIAHIKTLWAPDQQHFQEQVNQVRPVPP